MRFRQFVAGVGAGATVLAGCLAAVAASSPAHAASSSHDLRVGSFNILGVNTDKKAGGAHAVWNDRRPVVAGQILAQHLDVVGLQEANPSSIYASHEHFATTQYGDLRDSLNSKGGRYKVTDKSAYNCVHGASTYKCVYKNQHASGDTRILYDTTRVSLISHGALQYSHYTGTTPRYLAWAVMELRSTGRKFLFTDTHLDPYSSSNRQAEWGQMVKTINSLKGSLPVVAVGDFNTSKFSSYARSALSSMKSNGYGDVVGQKYDTSTLVHPRPQSLRRAWISSYNGFRRNVASYSYAKDRSKIGNGIDWVFASNSLTVKRWEVVANMNDRTLMIQGVIPSDHHLVTATLVL